MAATLVEALSRLAEATNNHNSMSSETAAANAWLALTAMVLGDVVLAEETEELLRTALVTLQTHLGAARVRETLLDLLPRVPRSTARQILLEHLPRTVVEDEDSDSQVGKNSSYPHQEAILQTMEHILERDSSAVLPVLQCLAAPGMVSRTELLRVALHLLPECEEKELPTAAHILLRSGCCQSETECVTAWRALRIEWRLLEEYYCDLMEEEQQQEEKRSELPEQEEVGARLLLAHAVVSRFMGCSHGKLLATTYLQCLETNCTSQQRKRGTADDETVDQQNGPLMLDLIVLLDLSETHEDVVDRIVDSWLCSNNGFPFALLDKLLQMLFGTGCDKSLFIPRLTPALIRWAIYLLLAPARCPESAAVSQVQAFVINLFQRLDGDSQAELAHSVLHLSEETVPLPNRVGPDENKANQSAAEKRGSKRRRQQAQDVSEDVQQNRRMVHQSVNAILKEMAGTAPSSFVGFKHVLTRRLMEMHCSLEEDDLDSVRETCSILSSLVVYPEQQHKHSRGALESSELLALLQKLLFSSSGLFGRSGIERVVQGDSGRMIRGMLLANELIRCPLRSSDKDCIKDWVLRLLLPTTRRMVSPELGTPGLEFLMSYLGSNEEGGASSSALAEVFQHLRNILANTGLVQILDNYQSKHKEEHTVLGYTTHPPEFRQSDLSKTRKMVFCFVFFLRHTDMSNPSRWHHAIKWVSGLVDTYLRMGRKHTTNWRPDGWLLASDEFPTLALSLDVTDEKEKVVGAWVRANLFHFGFAGRVQSDYQIPSDFAVLALRNLDLSGLRKLQGSVLQFTLSLLISIALSNAVLRNAFHHWKAQKIVLSEPPSLGLIKLQLSKIFDLRRKSEQMDGVLRLIHVGIGSFLSRKRVGVSRVEKNRLLAHIASAAREAEKLRQTRYDNEKIVGTEILWQVLLDPSDEKLLFDFLRSVGVQSQNELDPPATVVSRMIHLKTNMLRHILALASTPECEDNDITETRFLHCLRHSCLLMDCIPSLRRAMLTQNDPRSTVSMSQVVLLAASYLRLLVAFGSVVPFCRSRNKAENVFLHAVSLESYVEWCSHCPELFDRCEGHALSKAVVDEGLSIDVVFRAFERRLREADTFVIADGVLEILSILSVESDDRTRTQKVIDCSWIALHTVYTHEEIAADATGLPFALMNKPLHMMADVLSSDLQALKNILDATINKLNVRDKDQIVLHLRRAVLRHLGLLTKTTATMLFCHLDHVSALIGHLSSLCEALDNGIDSGEDEKKEDSRVRKHAQLPAIIGLEAATLPDYFSMLFLVVVAMAASSGPAIRSEKNCSPYQHLVEIFGLFRRLLSLYQKHFLIFPRKTASCVINTAKDMLTVAVAQLRCCIEWRSAQPLLSITERQAGKHDVGSILYLQQLIDLMAAQTASALTVFCDFWQPQEDNVLLSRCASLRLAAEKAVRSTKDISAAHNLVPPSFDFVELVDQRTEESISPTKGFHAMDSGNYAYWRKPKIRLRVIEDEEETIGMDDAIASASKDDDNDSGDSFGVAGGWGDASEDSDSSDEGLELESNFHVIRG